jgi:hypothetical protein
MDRFSETFFSRTSRTACENVAVNVCDNCEHTADDLHEVHEYRTAYQRFYACDDCYDEIRTELDREAEKWERREAAREQMIDWKIAERRDAEVA